MKLIPILLATVVGLSKSDPSDLIREAVSIANDAYKPFHLTTVAWWDHDQGQVNQFLKEYIGTVTTTRVKGCFRACRKTFTFKQAVFFAANPKEFERFFAIASKVTSKAMLVILVIINENYTSDLIEYFQIAGNRDVIDIVAVSTKVDTTTVVSTIVPYGRGICKDFSPIDVTMNQSNIFKENKYTNFYGCPIRVTALDVIPYVKLIKENDTVIDIGGIDGSLVKLVIEVLNATMDIVSTGNHGDFGYYTNKTAGGSFGDLYYNIADIMAPALIITTRRYPAAQITSVYRQSHIILCLPKRKEIYKWLKILLPFYNWTTPMLIAAAVGVVSTLKIIKIFRKHEYYVPNRTVFAIYSLFLGKSHNFNSGYWLINSLFVCWIWFSLVFRIFYEGRLVEGLHRIILQPPVKTIEEAIKVVNEVRIHSTVLEFYRDTAIEKHGILIKLPDIIPSLSEIADGKNILLATERGQAEVLKKNVQVLEDQIVNSPACIFLRPRFPAADYVSYVMLRISETGLFEKIFKDFSAGWVLHNFNKTVTLHVEPLRMKVLGSCFIALSVMQVVCFIIFGAEIYHNYYITTRGLTPLPFTH